MTRRFKEEELKQFKILWDEFVPLTDIGALLDRSPTVLEHKAKQLGWKRNAHAILMAYHHGDDILKYGKTPDEIRTNIRAEKDRAKIRKMGSQFLAIRDMKQNLRNKIPRNQAMRIALDAGATQKQVGAVVGLSKQGVCWLVGRGKI